MGFLCYLLIALLYEVFVSQLISKILYLIKILLNLDHKKEVFDRFILFELADGDGTILLFSSLYYCRTWL